MAISERTIFSNNYLYITITYHHYFTNSDTYHNFRKSNCCITFIYYDK